MHRFNVLYFIASREKPNDYANVLIVGARIMTKTPSIKREKNKFRELSLGRPNAHRPPVAAYVR